MLPTHMPFMSKRIRSKKVERKQIADEKRSLTDKINDQEKAKERREKFRAEEQQKSMRLTILNLEIL